MKKFLSIVLVIAIILVGYFFINYEKNIIEVKDKKNLEFQIEDSGKVIMIDEENKEFDEMTNNGKLSFLPISTLKDQNLEYDYDTKHNILTLSNRDHLIRINLTDNSIFIDDNEIKSNNLFKVVDNEKFIDYGLLNKYFEINALYNEEKRLILIEKYYETLYKGVIVEDGKLFSSMGNDSKEIRSVIKGETFKVLKINNKWYYAFNENLDRGYIKNGLIEKEDLNKDKNGVKEIPNGKIIMTWDQIFHSNPNVNKIGEMKGLNVISPTWFKMIDNRGNIKSLVSQEYINWARNRDYDMWVLVSNTFSDIEMTSNFLNDVYSREYFIKETLAEFKKYNFKGINIDFENIYMKDKDKFTQFISELVYYFDKEDIIVSVDVTVMGGSDNWSKCYNRKRLGELVDYLVIMTYDEHWASSPISGSVASYNWVKKSLEDIIEHVDSEKIIMGIPLYTRIWYETPSETKVNEMNVRSKAITMKGQSNLLNQINFDPIWDKSSRQFFVSYILDSKLKKVWLEEEKSIKEKLSIVNELDLAGASMWSRGFETKNIWEVINNEIGD